MKNKNINAQLRYMQTLVEQKEYFKANFKANEILLGANIKILDNAYDQLLSRNYGFFSRIIDQYFYQEAKMYNNLKYLTDFDGVLENPDYVTVQEIESNPSSYTSDNFDSYNDFDSNGTWCSACHEDPCRCSDPF